MVGGVLFAYFILNLACSDGAGTITWYEPPPVETTADTRSIHTNRTQLIEGSTNKELHWKFSLAADLKPIQDVQLKLNSVGIVSIAPSFNLVEVLSAFKDRFNVSWTNNDKVTLIIFNVSDADAGEFACDVKTLGGSTKIWTRKIQVDAFALPRLTNTSPDFLKVKESSDLQLVCKASGKPSPSITWTKGGSDSVLHRGPTLNLTSINSYNAGTYRCTADNGVGSAAQHTIQVIVEFSPRIDLNVIYYVAREGNAHLDCQAKGYPPPTITWTPCYCQDIKCDESFLNISKVQVSRALYTCRASNDLGEASANTTLVIGGKDIYLTLSITGVECTEENGQAVYDQSIWRELKSQVDTLYRSNNYLGTERLDVRCGSLHVDLVLKFKNVVSEDWVLSILRGAVLNGKLGKLSVNASSIVGIPPVIKSTVMPPTTTPTLNSGVQVCNGCSCNYTIFLAVVVVLVAVIIVLLIYVVWLHRRVARLKERAHPESPDEKTTVQMAKLESNLKETRQQELQGSSRGQYMDLDDARRSHDIPGASQTNTPQISQYAPLHPSTLSWEISRQHVKIEKVIGKGAFGQVAKVTAVGLRGIPQETLVAVKMLKADAPESDKKDLLSELEVMKTLKPHPHVIKLLGCVTESEPLLVLIEYVPYGDLLGYLRKSRGLNDTYYKDPDIKPQTSLTSQQLIKFAWQVADGMSYLSSRSIIHRDLAARNVLIGERETCKVTDFGMARDVQQENIYERKTKGRLPVKWTAYEALLFGKYTTKSDIWSYGVLLYEIFTIGGSPYPRMDGRKIASLLQQGYRMPKPPHVDDELYKIMMMCWEEEPDARPTFVDLRNKLKKMDKQNKKYINMNMYDTKLYANVEDLVV